MTPIEREEKFRAMLPAAIVALTDVINVFADTTMMADGTINPEEAMKSIIALEEIVIGTMARTSIMTGLSITTLMPGVLALARRILEQSERVPVGGLAK